MNNQILVNAEAHPDAIVILEENGFVPVVVPETDVEGSLAVARDSIAIVANASLAFDEAFFELASGVKVIGRMGVGYDNVDLEAAGRRGVRVVNTPLSIIEPVAEHAVMLMLAVLRRLVVGDREAREAMFRQPSNNPDFELRAKTLGIVGMGRTGFRVAQIARQGFQMEILYHDQVKNEAAEGELGASLVSLDELLERSDIVTLHVNLSDETRHLINSEALGKMGPGSYLINVSRGPVVDEAALVEALRNGEIAGAGIDVYEQEPPAADNQLWELDNVIVTPHRAGFSRESVYGSSMVVKDIVSVLKGEEPRFPVN